ncbi:sensor histidine kinase [Pareuzebyella sediminis]|uniref:sensor histidine kinase n=1 Tax=Pareuzebyella sediminis TaxID=2607998 RepID=UPI0011ED0546|nr:PAS domain-containing sensor histidine kinase [Pareuzebyella sediminis]
MKLIFKEKAPGTGSIKTVTLCCMAFTILAILLEVFIIEDYLAQYEGDARTMNLAGRQLSLAREIVKNLYGVDENPALLESVRGDARRWDSIHRFLRTDLGALDTEFIKTPVRDSLFGAIEPYRLNLLNWAMGDSIPQKVAKGYASLQKWEGGFTDGMTHLVDLYQKESDLARARLRHIVMVFSFFFILMILVLYFFLVEPIIRSMRMLIEEQKEQYRNLSSILENTDDLIWSVNRDYSLRTCNSAYRDRTAHEKGRSPELGESVLSHLEGEAALKDRELYDRAFRGETFKVDLELSVDGCATYHELSFNPIHGEDGVVIGCNVFRRDETERIETIQKLDRSRRNLREAQRIARIGNWNWDMASDELIWSECLYDVFGKDHHTFEATYANLMEIVHPDDRESYKREIVKSLAENLPLDTVHRILLPDGSVRYIHERALVFLDGAGDAVRMAGTSQDVTVLENAKQEIRKQYEELQNFVYIVSHNVRSPIATIQGLMELLEEGEEDKSEILGMIGRKVDVLDATIRDLNDALALRNVSSKSFKRIGLAGIFESIEELLERAITSSGAQIYYDFGGIASVLGIRSYVTNIMYNLVLNAIDYRDDNKDLKIIVSSKTVPHSGTVEVSIGDNGIGMDLDAERRKKIFGMYGRLDGRSDGKGLGLFLVKTQVEALQGKIAVTSKKGKGTTFTVTLKQGDTECPVHETANGQDRFPHVGS